MDGVSYSAWILWDIDGTLVRLRRGKRNRHAEALSLVVGDVVTRGVTVGMTDREVLRMILKSSGVEVTAEVLDQALYNLDVIAARDAQVERAEPLPGVVQALRAARSLGWTSGLLTGNTPSRARMKVESAGLWSHFESGPYYFGDQADSRTSLVEAALAGARGQSVHTVVVVGDTVRDVEAARRSGTLTVGIATGGSDVDELTAARADLVIEDLVSGFDAFRSFLAGKLAPDTEAPDFTG